MDEYLDDHRDAGLRDVATGWGVAFAIFLALLAIF